MPHRDVRLISKPLINVLASSASTNTYVRMRGTLTPTRSGEPGARVFRRAPGPQSLPAPEYSVRDQPAANPGQPSHRRSQLAPVDRDQNGLFRLLDGPRSCAGCAGCEVAHSAGPFSQEWAVTSRRTHCPPEDLPDDLGQLRVPVVFPPVRDIVVSRDAHAAQISTAHSCQNGPTEWAYSPTVKPPQQESSRGQDERTAHSYDDIAAATNAIARHMRGSRCTEITRRGSCSRKPDACRCSAKGAHPSRVQHRVTGLREKPEGPDQAGGGWLASRC